MNEEDSDSDASDTEQEEEMAGPSSTSKGSKGEASDAKPTTKNDLVSHLKLLFMMQYASITLTSQQS